MARRDTCGFCGHARMWHPGADYFFLNGRWWRADNVSLECVGDVADKRCGRRCSRFVEVVHRGSMAAQVVN